MGVEADSDRWGVQVADIFISYASKDRELASRVADALGREGWDVWWDRALIAGLDFEKEIREAQDGSELTVVLWTFASVESDWVKAEARRAHKRQRLVPAALPGLDPDAIPMDLHGTHLAKLSAEEARSGFPGLIEHVRRRLAIVNPTSPEPHPEPPGLVLPDSTTTPLNEVVLKAAAIVCGFAIPVVLLFSGVTRGMGIWLGAVPVVLVPLLAPRVLRLPRFFALAACFGIGLAVAWYPWAAGAHAPAASADRVFEEPLVEVTSGGVTVGVLRDQLEEWLRDLRANPEAEDAEALGWFWERVVPSPIEPDFHRFRDGLGPRPKRELVQLVRRELEASKPGGMSRAPWPLHLDDALFAAMLSFVAAMGLGWLVVMLRRRSAVSLS